MNDDDLIDEFIRYAEMRWRKTLAYTYTWIIIMEALWPSPNWWSSLEAVKKRYSPPGQCRGWMSSSRSATNADSMSSFTDRTIGKTWTRTIWWRVWTSAATARALPSNTCWR